MEKDKQLEQLDEVLKFLCKSVYAIDRISMNDIQVKLKEAYNYEIIRQDLEGCLNQLKEDKYILEDKHINVNGIENITYYPTWGGKYFQRTLGYQKKIDDKNYKKADLENLKTLENRLKKSQVEQNWWLVGLGSIAGLYYLTELLRWFYKWAHDFPY